MKIIFKQDVENILGPPDQIKDMTYPVLYLTKRDYYSVTSDLILTCAYDEKSRLLYLNWFEKILGRLFYIRLENIFEGLPEHWQNLVIFNLDLFQMTAYRSQISETDS